MLAYALHGGFTGLAHYNIRLLLLNGPASGLVISILLFTRLSSHHPRSEGDPLAFERQRVAAASSLLHKEGIAGKLPHGEQTNQHACSRPRIAAQLRGVEPEVFTCERVERPVPHDLATNRRLHRRLCLLPDR
jgi:hypothetical protein